MSVERDLLGWELDDVLEGYDVDYTVDTCTVNLDEPELEAIEQGHPPAVSRSTRLPNYFDTPTNESEWTD